MKLATWNLQLPVSSRRRAELRKHTDREQADLWVLTETHDGFSPGHPFSHSSLPGRDGRHLPEHRWVTIWSRYPIAPITTSDEQRSAAVRVSPSEGTPFIVFGTVLPWLGSRWRDRASSVAFCEALELQAADWKRLRQEFATDELFLLGDLNQDMVSPRYYGSRTNRAELEKALEDAGLTALTAGLGDPIRRDSAPRACIDHICARRDSTWRAQPAVRWPNLPAPDRRLSDHFGVSIVLLRP